MKKNYNSTGKKLFALYICNKCKNADSSLISPKMDCNIPFFIKCDCGSFKMFYGAYDTDPYTPAEVMTSIMCGEKKYLDMIFQGKFKDYGHLLEPDGTMDRDTLPTIDIDVGPDGELDPLVLKPKKEYEKRKNPTSAKQVCPICGNEFIVKDIELYLEIMNDAWESIKEAYPDGFTQQMNDEIYKRNHPDAIRKCIAEKGHFTGLCQPCMSLLSWSRLLGKGI